MEENMINFIRKIFKIHKWKYVHREYCDHFIGEPIRYAYKAFRICQICGETQEFCLDTIMEEWDIIDDDERRILLGKIIDKGDHYYLDYDIEPYYKDESHPDDGDGDL